MEEKMHKVEIRKGLPGDAEVIAKAVFEAMGIKDVSPLLMKALTDICGMEDTLYSYNNTDIALCDGRPAGVLISYDGADYNDMANRTFSLVAKAMGKEKLNPGTETGPGEYYMDSLYVLPEFRGRSIGKILMENGFEEIKSKGFTRVTLLVDIVKPWLHKLYGSVGFVMESEVMFFGEPFYKMAKKLK